MRRAAKVDENQGAVVAALRKAGASVLFLHTLGRGAPDLAVGFRGVNYFLEVKDGAKSLSRRALTDDEEVWHRGWRGQVSIVETVEQALWAIGAITKKPDQRPKSASRNRNRPITYQAISGHSLGCAAVVHPGRVCDSGCGA